MIPMENAVISPSSHDFFVDYTELQNDVRT